MSGSYQRLSSLLTFVLAFMFIESAMFGSVRCDDWPSSIQATSDESGWRSEIYSFLNYDNCDNINSICGASHSAPAYSTPTYTAAPTNAHTNTATYSTPSNNTPTNNQSIGNGNSAYWLSEANVSYLTGSYEQAAESYAKAVNIDPSLSVGWFNLGNSLYFLGKYQASLDAYNTLLNLEPQNANALVGKSKAILALSKSGERTNTSTVM